MQDYLQNINNYRYLHINSNVSDNYKDCSLHIAIERADINKDWENFNKLIRIAPQYLKNHLKLTSIFGYNYEKLSEEEQQKLFNIS
jgi:hypothetical protein